MIFNLQNGIGDDFSKLFIMLIPQLLKVDIFWIIRLKHFIDQWNEKVWHLLGDVPKHMKHFEYVVLELYKYYVRIIDFRLCYVETFLKRKRFILHKDVALY